MEEEKMGEFMRNGRGDCGDYWSLDMGEGAWVEGG